MDSAGKRALRIEAAADQLDVSRSTVYRMLETGQLRSVKVGRARLIPVAEIDRLLSGCSSPSPPAVRGCDDLAEVG